MYRIYAIYARFCFKSIDYKLYKSSTAKSKIKFV